MSVLTPESEVTPELRRLATEANNVQGSKGSPRDLITKGGGGTLSIIVLGASGDLAKKKTFPALFNLFKQGFLPSHQVRVFGYARSELTSEELRQRLRGYLKAKDPAVLNAFLELVTYTAGGYDSTEGFQKLEKEIVSHELLIRAGEEGTNQRLFYLALPPSVYPQVSTMIRQNNMTQHGWTRVIVEKPFGKDLDSSEELSQQLGALFTEDQLYRIDHYLGKEIVQNLLVMRFANRFFMPMWNRDNIANIQIVFKEDFGTEGRGGYFDQYGIVRDIIQNHLLQVLSLVAMEKPLSLGPEHVRDEKVKLLKAIRPPEDEDVVLGQYQGYKDDPGVPKDSNTPTFAQLVLHINNERWDGVPFIVKAGKALDSKKVEIRVQFRDVPGDIFKCKRQGRNEFVMRLQPSEAMYMKLTVKKPGLEMAATQSELDLSYKQRYQDVVIPEAYERLLLDTIRGDQQHFVRRDELYEAWKIFTPLLHRIDAGLLKSIEYPSGSRGPPEADEVLNKHGYVRTQGYIWVPPTLRSII
jgi:glucose-6-phosphate 1-dehydrogenase